LLQKPARISCVAGVQHGLFEAATIERMLGHLQVLLEAVTQAPEAKLARLPLLTNVEQQQLAEWNQTSREVRGETVVQLFEEQVRRTPEQVAVVRGEERITYAELNRGPSHWRRSCGAWSQARCCRRLNAGAFG
jgi:non-ribosomal peptide synthetase component F